ncbi:unnamed protein product [Ixodes hexagonus]
MEDSGIDSDSKTNGGGNGKDRQLPEDEAPPLKNCEVLPTAAMQQDEAELKENRTHTPPPEEPVKSAQELAVSKTRALQLQKRLERHIQQSKRIRQQNRIACVDTQPKKALLPRSRLSVPTKGPGAIPLPTGDTEPLVTWDEEEFEFLPTSKAAAREITQQLIKDGYDLDLTPDDDDLDLIPPKPLGQRCACCAPAHICALM